MPFSDKGINNSTNTITMVHNPIYEGPIYESVQPPLETITQRVLQETSAHRGPSISSQQSDPDYIDSSFTLCYVEKPLQGSQLQHQTLGSLRDITNDSTSSFPDSKSKFLDSSYPPTSDNAIVITNSDEITLS